MGDVNDIIRDIRALLVSVKGKMPIRTLERDYKSLMGHGIPFSQLGYKSLQSFLESQSNFKITNNNGDYFIDAVVSDKSAHISQMVRFQKAPKKKPIPRFASNGPRFQRQQHPPKKYYQPAASSYRYNARPPPPPRKNADWQSGKSGKPVQTNVRPKQNIGDRLQIQDTKDEPSNHIVEQTITNRDQIQFRKVDRTVNSNISKPKVIENITSSDETDTTSILKNGQQASLPCSSLVSTRRRLLAKMQDLKLSNNENQKDRMRNLGKLQSPTYSPNSPLFDMSPTFPSPLPSVQMQEEFSCTGNPVEDLKRFAEFHRLGEVVMGCIFIRQDKGYSCRVTVGKNGDNDTITFPKTYKTEEQAQKACCEECLQKLMKNYGQTRGLLVSESIDILSRIPKILEEHSNKALWESEVKNIYIERHKEQLPIDWLKILDKSDTVVISQVERGHTLTYCPPGTIFQKRQPQKLSPQEIYVSPQEIEIDSNNQLKAIVTCVVKVEEIWCQQEDTYTYVLFQKMSSEMHNYYESNSANMRVLSITKDSYYVAKFKEKWCRIRVIDEATADVLCFLIDFGDKVVIPRDHVYRLASEFAAVNAQAFRCCLYGLEHYYNFSRRFNSLDDLANQQVVLTVINIGGQIDSSLPVVMYNESMEFSYNDELQSTLLFELGVPDLEKGKIVEVSVSNIENSGDIYVRLQSQGYTFLMECLEEIEEKIETEPPIHLIKPVTRTDSENKLFLKKFRKDDRNGWSRIEIRDWAPNRNLAQIYFVDYGDSEVIDVDSELLYPLEELDYTLANYPNQAIRVRMIMDTIPEGFKKLAKKYMSHNDTILLKIVDYDKDQLPLGEFFKRNSEGLFCINKSIALENEIKKDCDNNNSKSPQKNWINKTKNVPSGGVLPAPPLPEKGGSFEVFVPLAVNPYNFFVQPLSSRPELNELMKGLQEHYDKIQPSPLPIEAIEPGMIYASKSDNDYCWFRTTVLKVINETSISVVYCDFGHYTSLSVYNLVPLDPMFMELPFQALKAEIPDIKPVQSKWTMDDCGAFKEMVENKALYCILKDIQKDKLNPEDDVLSLIMIDTTSSNDVYISKELIRNNRAVLA